MTSEQPTYKFKLLQEEAVNEDSLEGSIHEKVADQLIEILNSNDSGLTIGIEGAWGSGKSTVVNIFRSKLDERTLFFNFDAWAHEGDPLRRIFLEKLILCSTPDMDNEGLKNLFEKISGRKKIVNVKSKSESSNLGKWLGMSALLVPLGGAFKARSSIFIEYMAPSCMLSMHRGRLSPGRDVGLLVCGIGKPALVR